VDSEHEGVATRIEPSHEHHKDWHQANRENLLELNGRLTNLMRQRRGFRRQDAGIYWIRCTRRIPKGVTGLGQAG